MFGIQKRIARGIKKEVLGIVVSFYKEHVEGGEIVIEPDLNNKSIKIKFVKKV